MKVPRFTRKSKVVTAFLCGMALIAGGASYAYISTSTQDGGDSNAGAVGSPTVVPIRVTATFAPGAQLVPGGSVPVQFTAYNDAAVNEHISNFAPVTQFDPKAQGYSYVVPTGSNTCQVVNDPSKTPDVTGNALLHLTVTTTGSWTIPPHGQLSLGTGTLSMDDSPTVDQSGCLGAAVHIVFLSV